MKTGLVLEGGAHRAIYTAGVLDVFMENNIAFDGVIGVSAGAIHGCSYVAQQKGRSIAYTLKYAADRRYMSFYSLLTTGNMVGEKFCYHELPDKLFPFDYAKFAESGVDFYVTCSNLETGKAEYILCRDMKRDMAYLRASASMPFVSRVSEIDDKKLLDGGICDSIPVRAFQNMGFERCVCVLTREYGYRKKANKLNPIAGIFYHRYPKFAAAIRRRHLMYNEELADISEQEQAGKIFVIRPGRLIKISHTEKNKKILQAVYELGRKDAQNALPKLQNFLQNGINK
jgi:predicted patatin/cPLA2 family phospholipase